MFNLFERLEMSRDASTLHAFPGRAAAVGTFFTASTAPTSRRLQGLAAACVAVLLGAASLGAEAQPRDDRHEQRHGQRHGGRHDDRGRDDGRHGDRRHDDRRGPPAYRHPGPPPQAYHGGPVYRPGPPMVHPGHPQMHGQRGVGPQHNWYRGSRVPPMYRSHHYVVNNWRHHHLAPPPRGYHWVQNGPDYLLIAIGTGVIAQIVFQ